jgi:hypothetical protein
MKPNERRDATALCDNERSKRYEARTDRDMANKQRDARRQLGDDNAKRAMTGAHVATKDPFNVATRGVLATSGGNMATMYPLKSVAPGPSATSDSYGKKSLEGKVAMFTLNVAIYTYIATLCADKVTLFAYIAMSCVIEVRRIPHRRIANEGHATRGSDSGAEGGTLRRSARG